LAKTVYIHIGLPKTGTSSIQLVMRAAEDDLRVQGVVYPADAQQISNHRTFLAAVGGRRMARVTKLDAAKCQALIAGTTAKFRSDPTVGTLVWSHESLAGSVPRWEFGFLEALVAGFDLKVILYIRYTSDWMESQYRQLLWGQSLRPMDSISREELLGIRRLCERWLRNVAPGSIYGTLVARLPRAEILLRSFDADRHNDQLVPKFLELIGADLRGASQKTHAAAHKANVSRPAVDTALLHEMWRGGLDPASISVLATTLQKTAKSAVSFDTGIRLRLVPQECREAARATYAAAAEAFPQLPSEPEEGAPITDAAELHERQIARLESVRERLGPDLFRQILQIRTAG
jgi:hypothetical protein